MTFADLQKVEEFIGELCHDYLEPTFPARLSTEYERVEIDLTYSRFRVELVRDWLAQKAERLGYLYDFWFPDGEPHRTLCVSERGADE